MKRLSIKSIRTASLAGIGAICGAVAVMQITAADRLVDGGYDQVIAVASLTSGSSPSALLRRASIPSLATSEPTAATEHVWLTHRSDFIEPLTVDAAPDVSAIGSTVGARFVLASAGEAITQTFEVVDVREITAEYSPADQLVNDAIQSGGLGKMLLVSCKVVAEGRSPARAGLVRFVVDADPHRAGSTHPLRLPRAL
jgi:hypothetical protein